MLWWETGFDLRTLFSSVFTKLTFRIDARQSYRCPGKLNSASATPSTCGCPPSFDSIWLSTALSLSQPFIHLTLASRSICCRSQFLSYQNNNLMTSRCTNLQRPKNVQSYRWSLHLPFRKPIRAVVFWGSSIFFFSVIWVRSGLHYTPQRSSEICHRTHHESFALHTFIAPLSIYSARIEWVCAVYQNWIYQLRNNSPCVRVRIDSIPMGIHISTYRKYSIVTFIYFLFFFCAERTISARENDLGVGRGVHCLERTFNIPFGRHKTQQTNCTLSLMRSNDDDEACEAKQYPAERKMKML